MPRNVKQKFDGFEDLNNLFSTKIPKNIFNKSNEDHVNVLMQFIGMIGYDELAHERKNMGERNFDVEIWYRGFIKRWSRTQHLDIRWLTKAQDTKHETNITHVERKGPKISLSLYLTPADPLYEKRRVSMFYIISKARNYRQYVDMQIINQIFIKVDLWNDDVQEYSNYRKTLELANVLHMTKHNEHKGERSIATTSNAFQAEKAYLTQINQQLQDAKAESGLKQRKLICIDETGYVTGENNAANGQGLPLGYQAFDYPAKSTRATGKSFSICSALVTDDICNPISTTNLLHSDGLYLKLLGSKDDNMNFKNFSEWFIEHIIPQIEENTIVLMDNAKYHKCPSEENKEILGQKKKKLREHQEERTGKKYKRWNKKKMWDDNKEYFNYQNKAKLERLVEEKGGVVIYTPSKMHDFQPIEYLWNMAKRSIRNMYKNSTTAAKTEI